MAKKEFRGVWIHRSILSDPRLTIAEKMLLGYTHSFHGKCTASNKFMAERLGVSRQTIANCLVDLRKKGVINGRNYTILLPQTGHPLPETVYPLTGNSNIEQSIEQSKDREREPEAFCFEKPEDLPRILPFLAVRGLGERDIREAWSQIAAERAAGSAVAIRNPLFYLEKRVELNVAKAARQAKLNGQVPRKPAAPQFSKTYN